MHCQNPVFFITVQYLPQVSGNYLQHALTYICILRSAFAKQLHFFLRFMFRRVCSSKIISTHVQYSNRRAELRPQSLRVRKLPPLLYLMSGYQNHSHPILPLNVLIEAKSRFLAAKEIAKEHCSIMWRPGAVACNAHLLTHRRSSPVSCALTKTNSIRSVRCAYFSS